MFNEFIQMKRFLIWSLPVYQAKKLAFLKIQFKAFELINEVS